MRTFTKTQRDELFKKAAGRCNTCCTALKDDWQADHIKPYSKGGTTTLDNGQALCTTCNQIKGNQIMNTLKIVPRDWQLEAQHAVLETFKTKESALVEATPGAGKTIFALMLAKHMMDNDLIDKVVILVPSAKVKQQWAKESASLFGLRIYKNVLSPEDVTTKKALNSDGYVTTYHTMNNRSLNIGAYSTEYRTLFICDEYHHISGNSQKAWNKAIYESVQGDFKLLAISGTPWTADDSELPFFKYDPDEEGNLVPNTCFRYEAERAIEDKVIVRLEADCFCPKNFRVSFDEAERTFESISKAHEEDQNYILRALYKSPDIMLGLFERGQNDLEELQALDSQAGGLIVALNQKAAYAWQALLKAKTGKTYPVTVSGDRFSNDVIEDFKNNTHDDWLISVQKVTEGVDIKRLKVLIYASVIKTPLFLRQVVGRVVRTIPDSKINFCKVVFVDHPKVTTVMKEIGAEIPNTPDIKFITKDLVPDSGETGEEPDEGPAEFDFPQVEITNVGEGTFDFIYNGNQIDPQTCFLIQQARNSSQFKHLFTDRTFSESFVIYTAMRNVAPDIDSIIDPGNVQSFVDAQRYLVKKCFTQSLEDLDEYVESLHTIIHQVHGFERYPENETVAAKKFSAIVEDKRLYKWARLLEDGSTVEEAIIKAA